MIRDHSMRALRAWALALVLAVAPSAGWAATPVDPNATADTKQLLDYLYSLMPKSSAHVLTGQTIWRDMVVGSGPYMWSLLNDTIAATGKRPAIYQPISTSYSDALARQTIMDHWNAGGLVMLSIFLGNEPAKADWYNHAPLTNAEADQLMADPRYIQLMDDFADNVLQYQAQGVVFIARLFPEANGNWNWFSFPDQNRFILLWKQFQARMALKGVHNLIYLFCPADEGGSYLYGYPGDAFVDLTGLDSYQALNSNLPTIAGYATMSAKDKPMIIGEYGPFRLDAPITYQHKNAAFLVPGLTANMPDVVAIVNWTTPYNLTGMTNLTTYMSDPYVVNAPVPWKTFTTPGGATPFFSEDFEVISWAALIAKHPPFVSPYYTTSCIPPCSMDVVPGVGKNGSTGLRMTYHAPWVADVDDSALSINFTGVTDLWERYDVRWSCIPGESPCGVAAGSNGAKQHYVNPGGSLGNEPNFVTMFGPFGGGTIGSSEFGLVNQSNVSHPCPAGTYSAASGITCNLIPTNIARVLLRPDVFFCVENHYGPGIAEQYLDGQLIASWTSAQHNILTPSVVNKMQIFRQYSQGMYRDEDNWALSSTGRIGCSGTVTPPPPPDTTKPNPPSGITANAGVGSVALGGTAGTDNKDTTLTLRIERCSSGGATACNTNYAVVRTQAVTGGQAFTYNDTGLTASVLYCYRMAEQDVAGNLSIYTATICAAPSTVVPSVAGRTTMVRENFNRADNTDLNGEWTDSYTARTNLRITSSAVRNTGVGQEGMESYVGLSGGLPGNQWIEAGLSSVSTANSTAGALLVDWAATPTVTGYQCMFRRNSTVLSAGIRRYDNNVSTTLVQLAPNAITWAAGDVIRCERQGSEIRMLRNGTVIVSANDTTYTSGTVGMMLISHVAAGDIVLDNVTAGGFSPTSPSFGFQTLGTDDFNRANNADLGANWTDSYTNHTNLQIVGNRVRATQLNLAEPKSLESYSGAAAPNDQWCQVTLATFTGAEDREAGCMLRMPDPPALGMYFCYARKNGSSATTIGRWYTSGVGDVNLVHDYTILWGAGDKMRCAAEGSLISIYRTPAGSMTESLIASVVDSTFTSGKVGVWMWVHSSGALANTELDDFAMGGFGGTSGSTFPRVTSALCDASPGAAGCNLTYSDTVPAFIRVQVSSATGTPPTTDIEYPIASFPSGRYSHPGGIWPAGVTTISFIGLDAQHQWSGNQADVASADLTALAQQDVTPPVLTAGFPNGETLAQGTTATTIIWTTNEAAFVKFDDVDQAYDLMDCLGLLPCPIPPSPDGKSHGIGIGGLTNGVSKTYYGRAQDRMAFPNTATSSTVMNFSVATVGVDTTKPSTIADLALQGVSQTQAAFSFTPPTDNVGVSSIRLTLGLASGGACTPSTIAATWANVSPQSVPGLDAATAYCAIAQAIDAAGNLADASNTVLFTTPAFADLIPPGTVQNVRTVTDGLLYNSHTITWDIPFDNFGISSYLVQRCEASTCPFYEVVGVPLTNIFVDDTIRPSTGYQYLITARDPSGNVSAPSAVLLITSPPVPPDIGTGLCPCGSNRLGR